MSKTTHMIIKNTIKEMKEVGLSNSFIKKEIIVMFEGDISKEDVTLLIENNDFNSNKRAL